MTLARCMMVMKIEARIVVKKYDNIKAMGVV